MKSINSGLFAVLKAKIQRSKSDSKISFACTYPSKAVSSLVALVMGLVLSVGCLGASSASDYAIEIEQQLADLNQQIKELQDRASQLNSTLSENSPLDEAQLNTGLSELEAQAQVQEREALRFAWQLIQNTIIAPGVIEQLNQRYRQLSAPGNHTDPGKSAQLQLTSNEIKQVHKNFIAAQELYAAQQSAEQNLWEWKMFTKRMYLTEPPSKAKVAIRLIEEAKASQSIGQFSRALEQWQAVAPTFQQAYQQVIDTKKQWLEEAKRQSDSRKHAYLKLFSDYFITLPAGQFTMGSELAQDEQPLHQVSIRGFKLGRTEVTFAMWDACVASKSCQYRPHDQTWGRGQQPVINISFADIQQQFIPWLDQLTGKKHRLPSEAEWEYAARADSTTLYSWGDSINCQQAAYNGGPNSNCKLDPGKSHGPKPVGQYPANDFGLQDMHGNVWEWTQDCWQANYENAAANGAANLNGECTSRVLRGGAWNYDKNNLRSSNRFQQSSTSRQNHIGFRLVQE